MSHFEVYDDDEMVDVDTFTEGWQDREAHNASVLEKREDQRRIFEKLGACIQEQERLRIWEEEQPEFPHG